MLKYVNYLLSSSSVGHVSNITDVLQPIRLIVLTLSPPTLSKGRRAEDFFALKNPDGFGPV